MKKSAGLKLAFSSLMLTFGGVFLACDLAVEVSAVRTTFNNSAEREAYVAQLDRGQGGTLAQQQDLAAYAKAERTLKGAPFDLGVDGVMLIGGLALAARGIRQGANAC